MMKASANSPKKKKCCMSYGGWSTGFSPPGRNPDIFGSYYVTLALKPPLILVAKYPLGVNAMVSHSRFLAHAWVRREMCFSSCRI